MERRTKVIRNDKGEIVGVEGSADSSAISVPFVDDVRMAVKEFRDSNEKHTRCLRTYTLLLIGLTIILIGINIVRIFI